MQAKNIKKTLKWTIALTLALNLVFMVKDISDDFHEGAGLGHIGPEIFIILGTVLTAILALLQVIRFGEQTETLKAEVAELKVANEDWQNRTRSYSEGLSLEIDRQMARWGLSLAEKEIALLLLKGLTNKEISEIRSTSEHTIKQQSSAIYRKSGLKSRSELSAFFLEDLLSVSHQSRIQSQMTEIRFI
jgi:DNA-binding CsgD family transcriptional regulator